VSGRWGIVMRDCEMFRFSKCCQSNELCFRKLYISNGTDCVFEWIHSNERIRFTQTKASIACCYVLSTFSCLNMNDFYKINSIDVLCMLVLI
jgi:hypothetical protein